MSDGKSPDNSPFLDNLAAYRQSLIAAEQEMQREYDKNVLLLSGGALGISFAYLKDIVGTQGLLHGGCLLCAWILWGLSISAALTSYFTSAKALRKAVLDVDLRTIYLTLAESVWATWTKGLNLIAGLFFFLGVAMLVVFVAFNLPR